MVGERAPRGEKFCLTKGEVRLYRSPSNEQEVDRIVFCLTSHFGAKATLGRIDDGQRFAHGRLKGALFSGCYGQKGVLEHHERFSNLARSAVSWATLTAVWARATAPSTTA